MSAPPSCHSLGVTEYGYGSFAAKRSFKGGNAQEAGTAKFRDGPNTRAAGLCCGLTRRRERSVPNNLWLLSVEGFVAGPVKSPGVPFLHRLFPTNLFDTGLEVHTLG